MEGSVGKRNRFAPINAVDVRELVQCRSQQLILRSLISNYNQYYKPLTYLVFMAHRNSALQCIQLKVLHTI